MEVLQVLQALSKDRSKVVLLTIHQPSNRLFLKFERVVLVSPHGNVVYAGERSRVIDYFVKEVGLPDLPSGYSPAEYLLDLVCPATSTSQDEFQLIRRERRLAKIYTESSIFKQLNMFESHQKDNSQEQHQEREIIGYFWQFLILLQRSVQRSVRNPALVTANVGLSIAVAGLIAALYESMVMDLDGLISRAGLFFFSLSFFMLSTIVAFGLWQEEKLLFLHERSSGIYRSSMYFMARTVTDVLLLQLLPVCCMFSLSLSLSLSLSSRNMLLIHILSLQVSVLSCTMPQIFDGIRLR